MFYAMSVAISLSLSPGFGLLFIDGLVACLEHIV